MTVEALAVASDLQADDIQRYETGEQIPVDRLSRLARALRLPMSEFFVLESAAPRAAPSTAATTAEGLELVSLFRTIADAQLRATLIEIARDFAQRE